MHIYYGVHDLYHYYFIHSPITHAADGRPWIQLALFYLPAGGGSSIISTPTSVCFFPLWQSCTDTCMDATGMQLHHRGDHALV